MRTLTAICLGWSAFIAGCSAATSADDSNAGAPANEQETITPSGSLAPPRLRAPGEIYQLPPMIPGDRPIVVADPAEDEPVEGEGTGEEPVTEPPITKPSGPWRIDGNPTCAQAFPESGAVEFKLDDRRLKDGTYTDGKLTVTVDFKGSSIDYTANCTVLGVIVKGGPWAMVYGGGETGTDLSTPEGEAISHVSFCYVPTAN